MIKTINGYKYKKYIIGKAEILISLGEQDFNMWEKEGLLNIENLKKESGLDHIGYSKQIHSDIINIYDGELKSGDALITNINGVGLGVFTADCVPVLIIDNDNGVIAAIHSGWKGTNMNIVGKTIDRMNLEFKSKTSNLSVVIGPHIGSCCYEVGSEVKDVFSLNPLFHGKNIFENNNNNLNLSQCIKIQLSEKCIKNENIFELDLCTFCEKEMPLHSYRREKENYGRNFSLIYIK